AVPDVSRAIRCTNSTGREPLFDEAGNVRERVALELVAALSGDREEARALPRRERGRVDLVELDLAADARGTADGLHAGAARAHFDVTEQVLEHGARVAVVVVIGTIDAVIEIDAGPPVAEAEPDAVELTLLIRCENEFEARPRVRVVRTGASSRRL